MFRPRLIDANKVGAPVSMVLNFRRGKLVDIEINNNAACGYDVRAELLGETGSVLLRAPVYSEIHTALTRQAAYPADWRPRFADAYRLQNRAWLKAIETGAPSSVAANAWDGHCATLVAEAGPASPAAGPKWRSKCPPGLRSIAEGRYIGGYNGWLAIARRPHADLL